MKKKKKNLRKTYKDKLGNGQRKCFLLVFSNSFSLVIWREVSSDFMPSIAPMSQPSSKFSTGLLLIKMLKTLQN